MALVVEDGSGVAGAESYLSVLGADAYHLANGNAAWASAATPAKEAALRKGARYLDGSYGARFPGFRAHLAQGLLWPRYDAYDLDGLYVDPTTVPLPLQQANAELALRALSAELAPDESFLDRLTDVKVGPIGVSLQDGASLQPTYAAVDLLLQRILGSSNRLVVA